MPDAPFRSSDRGQQMTLAAVSLLEEHGPEAVTARKVTAKVDMSSIAIYTEFGSMAGLVASVVDHGFTLLLQRLKKQSLSEDALADLWGATCKAREFALAHPHLYAVMFATRNIGGHERTGAELQQGTETLRGFHRMSRHAVETGQLAARPGHVTRQLWTVIHGHLMLELAGYLTLEADRQGAFADIIATTLTGLGADPDAARAAVGLPQPRLPATA